MRTLYKAELETRHFSFESYGLSAREARANLVDGLKEHGRQTNLIEPWYLSYEINVTPIDIGTAYRDGQPIHTNERN